jgi:hypothetical protein
MSRWPDFFVVGAARAGTTSLYYYLRGHPDIFMPSIKEPHFFSDTYTIDGTKARLPLMKFMKVVKDEGAYNRLFQGVGSNQIAGEASTSYLFDKSAALRIKEKVPQAKIIILLREPVDRAYSHYLLGIRTGLESLKPFYAALIEDYEQPQKVWGSTHLYTELGLYYEQVKRYLNMFGRSQVRVYLYEDLVSDVVALVSDICGFLGVPFQDGRFFDASARYNSYNKARHPVFAQILRVPTMKSLAVSYIPGSLRVRLHRWLLDHQQLKPPLDPQAQEFLRSIYHDDILKLQELIGRDLSRWLVEKATSV